MSETTKDSRKKSLSEAFVNSFGSYPIGYGIGIFVLPLSLGWLDEDPFMANIFSAASRIKAWLASRISILRGSTDGCAVILLI